MALGTFIDLARAFDFLNRDILMGKLEQYGVVGTPLAWVRSYLSDRRQFVSYKGVNSEVKPVEFGVIQGSICGPVLFLIFLSTTSSIAQISLTSSCMLMTLLCM